MNGIRSAWFCRVATAGLMIVSGFAAMAEANVAAFYPFREGVAGASAVGVSITNRIGSSHVGAATATTGADVRFSDDVPAAYVFAGKAWAAEPYCDHPGAIEFAGSATGSGKSGRISFANLSDVVSAGDYTVEFFFKPEVAYGAPVSILKFDHGRHPADSEVTEFNLWYPIDAPGLKMRVGGKGTTWNDGLIDMAADFPSTLFGGWHHFAVVVSGTSFKYYVDYVERTSRTRTVTLPESRTGSLEIGMDNFQGKISCLRVTGAALSPTAEFLYLSNFAHQYPETAFHYTFESQVVGSDVSSETNADESFGKVNAGVLRPASAAVVGTVSVGADEVLPKAVSNKNVRLTVAGETVLCTNGLSLKTHICTADQPGQVNFLSGTSLVTPASLLPEYRGPRTLEGFFCYDGKGVLEEIQKLSNPRTRMHLMGILNDGATSTTYASVDIWSLFYDVSSKKFSFTVAATDSSGTLPASSVSSTSVAAPESFYKGDGKFHHLAMTYDDQTEVITLYYDYKELLTYDLASLGKKLLIMPRTWNLRSLAIGSGRNGNVFSGAVDDVRYTYGKLKPDQFLKHAKIPRGMMLIFR